MRKRFPRTSSTAYWTEGQRQPEPTLPSTTVLMRFGVDVGTPNGDESAFAAIARGMVTDQHMAVADDFNSALRFAMQFGATGRVGQPIERISLDNIRGSAALDSISTQNLPRDRTPRGLFNMDLSRLENRIMVHDSFMPSDQMRNYIERDREATDRLMTTLREVARPLTESFNRVSEAFRRSLSDVVQARTMRAALEQDAALDHVMLYGTGGHWSIMDELSRVPTAPLKQQSRTTGHNYYDELEYHGMRIRALKPSVDSDNRRDRQYSFEVDKNNTPEGHYVHPAPDTPSHATCVGFFKHKPSTAAVKKALDVCVRLRGIVPHHGGNDPETTT